MASPLDLPAALPSPPTSPTSPTSPRTATTRLRIKPPRRQDSLGNVPFTPGSDGPAEQTRSTPQFLSQIVTAESPDIRTVISAKRRQSSIAYYTPSSPSPWSQQPQLNRTRSSGGDGPRDAEPVVVNGKESGFVSKRSSLVLSSRSPSTRDSVSSLDAAAAREREPLTLVEKHADLLHFIAQKERKCLELRDQLAAHEKELAELKRKWGRIVNRGHDPLPNPVLAAGISGAALDGLKEGVRMIAAGFSDLGGVIHDLESPSNNDSFKTKHLSHTPRENGSARAKRTGSEHLSMSSMSSIQENMHSSDHVPDGEEGVTMTMTVATAPSLARASSLNSRMHKRASRVICQEPTTPTTASVSPPAQSPKSANLDVGMSLVLAPSPTLVPPLSSVVSASATPAPKSPVMRSAHRPVSMAGGPMPSWMDSMGKKLSELQKGQTFSKSQQRASLLLAGVSSTISSALSPGPTATTPAPLPILSSPASTKSSLTKRPPASQPQLQLQSQDESRSYPSYKSMADWLDEEEEQAVHADGVLIPDSKLHPRRTTDVVAGSGEAGATATAVSSFDEDWNW